ncbi:glycine betaine/proline transport system permease protein [Desulfonispora thiosulfatigenes DSM 11270]|uniref:Glycine betaine/proline transport system permease protein n=1 Tax=Desulfonispora thiosulfatigenes DSM 11270 TaxID=656914 RepID=A0A1W1V3M2_DESTI|nr:proline/glycine betaine ABC transporter permease [Desulfonispora thiosulfatigenes]SMB87641.1 glycine betaine/proline transport system permease protein [Desulfonispora thiosulfatigenes DSM 11270]
MKMPFLPKIPIEKAVDNSIDWLTDNFSFITKAISDYVEIGIKGLVTGLDFIPPWLFIIIATFLVFYLTKNKGLGSFTFLGLLLIWNLGLWEATMSTIALVLFATSLALLIGVPLGILAALFDSFYKVVMPILDFMQTMPAFVYLIPAIPFFGLGVVSAAFATVIFAMPPSIRLTCLGIRQVPEELIEASEAFGSTRMQKLVKLQIPIATPTIMAGINQTIMLSLSMVVIAAMIGAKGLGGEVWTAIQRFKPGMGFEAGLGVVIIAIIFDRVTQTLAKNKK